MKPIVLFGTGPYASLAFHYLSRQPGYRVAGFAVDPEFVTGETFCGLKVVPFQGVEGVFQPAEYDMLVTVGYTQLNALRAKKCQEAKAKGYRLASFLHPTNVLWDGFKAGENSIFFEGNIFQPFSKVGNNVCIWAGCVISHHVEIGDNVYLAPGAVLSGGVKVGNNSFIGSNAVLRDGIRVGQNCIIGAGAVILKDVGDGEVHAGQEARPLPVLGPQVKNI